MTGENGQGRTSENPEKFDIKVTKMKEQKLLSILQNKILAYDKVLLLSYDTQRIVTLLNGYPKEFLQKKILLLLGDAMYSYPDGIDYIELDEESCTALRRLYHTYEFSDKFRILSADSNFGTIWNYIKTGLLTPEEAVSALLS